MELKEYLDEFKRRRAEAKKYVEEQYNKGNLVYDSVTYQSVNRLESNGWGMEREFKDENEKSQIPLNTVKKGVFGADNKTLTVHTDNMYLRRIDFEKKGKVYPMFDGYLDLSEDKNKPQTRYIRCYAEPYDDKTTYDIMTVQVGDNEFFSSRLSFLDDDMSLTPELKEGFFKKVEELFEKEKEKCVEPTKTEENAPKF